MRAEARTDSLRARLAALTCLVQWLVGCGGSGRDEDTTQLDASSLTNGAGSDTEAGSTVDASDSAASADDEEDEATDPGTGAEQGSGADTSTEQELGPCARYIECATQTKQPITPILSLYGEDGTCWDEFGETACWLDCRAQLNTLHQAYEHVDACKVCEDDADCAVWPDEPRCGVGGCGAAVPTGCEAMCERIGYCCDVQDECGGLVYYDGYTICMALCEEFSADANCGEEFVDRIGCMWNIDPADCAAITSTGRDFELCAEENSQCPSMGYWTTCVSGAISLDPACQRS